MLAETLPDPNSYPSIGWAVVILAALALGGNQIWEIINRMRGDAPEPPNGQLAQSVKQLNARMKILETWRGSLTAKMEEDKNQILAAGEHRAEKIHDRINDVLSAVSELRGTVNEMKR